MAYVGKVIHEYRHTSDISGDISYT